MKVIKMRGGDERDEQLSVIKESFHVPRIMYCLQPLNDGQRQEFLE